MAVLDILIAGGTVITPQGERRIDLGIRGERIALWADPSEQLDAKERIDVTGMIVLPGAIDAHVHMREPGIVHKEGFKSGSLAAAAGGITTMMVMPTDNPWTHTPAQFEEKRKLAEAASHVDFGLQAVGLDPAHVATLAKLGAISFEIFLGDAPAEWTVTDMGQLAILLNAIADAGGVAGVTPADNGIIAAATEAEKGATDRLSFFRTRPPVSEALGVAKACALVVETGARVHLRQISCAASFELLRNARAKHSGLSAEVTPHNLYLTESELERQGPWAKVLPPLRKESDLIAMWQGLVDGDIDIVASDHAPHTPDEKRPGETDLSKAPGGFPGVQTIFPLMLDAVAAGRLSWLQLVRICSENPARLFGIGDRKGSLVPGADADIVIVDPKKTWTIRNEEQRSKAGITPFAGRQIRGQPVRSLLRGRTLMRNGEIEGAPAGRMVAPGG